MTARQGRSGITAFALILLGALAPGWAAAQPGGAALLVDPLRNELSGADRIGAKRTGVLCAPAGALLWSDVAPDRVAVAERVATALSGAGYIATLSTDAPSSSGPAIPAARRVTITVTGADIDACVPQHGWFRMMGGRKSLKARGSIALRWRVTGSGRAKALERELVEQLDEKTPAKSLPAAVETAILASAGKIATELSGPAPN